ncbi:MAG: rhomboid family intramembrane serine protease, partial [Flavobacteriales bacterium]|nr:rhomboid family intramembrane serine protease [Flavobacteriales bacterium]
MNTIWNDIKSNFKNGSSFTRLLYINIVLFVIYILIHVPQAISEESQITLIETFRKNYLILPADLNGFLSKPWTIITYMFQHKDILQLFFNMLWMYFGSKIFLQFFNGKQLISTYFLGGVFGGFCFLLFNEYLDFNSPLIGSSSSVISIIIAIATYQPNFNIFLPFIGNIKLKHIAWVSLLLFYINLSGNNSGGNISHLGGALFGYLYIILLKKGYDISLNFYNIIGVFNFTKTRKPRKKSRKKRSSKGN